MTPLEGLGVLNFIDDEFALTPELTAFATPGHSPGHMSVLVSSAGEKAIILGDVLLHPAQVSEPDWSSRMDMDKEVASETRQRILDRVEAEAMTMAAGHIRETPFGQLVRIEGRRYWESIAPGN